MVDIATLSRDEQLDLLERIWDQLSEHPESLVLSEDQKAELDRRLDDLDREGPIGIPAEEVLARLVSVRQ